MTGSEGVRKRPIGVVVVSALLVLAGVVGLVADCMNSQSLSADHYAAVWIALVNVVWIVAAVFVFRGRDWARWLAIAWMAFHVAISLWNSRQQIVVHGVIFALMALILLRRDASDFFRGANRSAERT